MPARRLRQRESAGEHRAAAAEPELDLVGSDAHAMGRRAVERQVDRVPREADRACGRVTNAESHSDDVPVDAVDLVRVVVDEQRRVAGHGDGDGMSRVQPVDAEPGGLERLAAPQGEGAEDTGLFHLARVLPRAEMPVEGEAGRSAG